MEAVKCPFHILIADGSMDEENKKIIDGNKHRFSHVSFKYLRYPPDNTILDFERKMADALSKIDTPYVMWNSNDDFPIVGAMLKCIDYLEQDKKNEFVACCGQFHLFALKANKPFGVITHLSSFHSNYYKNGNVLLSDAKNRVLSQMPFKFPFIQYSILRTNVFCKILQQLVENNITDSMVSEFFIVRSLICNGKYNELRTISLLFSQLFTSIWTPDFFIKKVLLGNFVNEHKTTMKLLAEQIVQSSSPNSTQANVTTVQEELESHFVDALNPKTLGSFLRFQSILNSQYILRLRNVYQLFKGYLANRYLANLSKYKLFIYLWFYSPQQAKHLLQSINAFQKVSKHLPDDIKEK
jgi:glycosyltransferase domain-containing protein